MTELHWTAGLHHDGSALYVSNPLPALGEVVTIRLRTPRGAPIRGVYLRTAPDGENHLEKMQIVDEDARSYYWAGSLSVTMPRNPYRFKIISDEGAYHFNAVGVGQAEWPDWFDFKLLADYKPPAWVADAVFYQIFPDRFHNGDPQLNPEPGAWSRGGHAVQVMEWGRPPLPWKEAGNLDFYGGDLPGIQQKIDYLKALGVNALYLTPIFSSHSNHRYNTHDFHNVDPHLGGNDALIELKRALEAVEMRLVLDLTPNHTSSDHAWFTAAQEDPEMPTAEFYTFYKRPNDYLSWLGVSSLPKLNYSSERLRDVMYRQPDSVMHFWLRPPFNIDGWRLDVYNMMGRQGGQQLGHEVGREMRQAIKAEHPEAFVFGEHFFDGSLHLQGDEVDAMMNYQGFNIPMWRWLAGFDLGADQPENASADPLLMPSDAFVEQLMRYRAVIPWVVARQQFNQLGSHDTTRILTLVGGDKGLVRLGVTLLMMYPGVPCIYYGDEIGLEGERDPDNRRCMPWDKVEWDTDLLSYHQRVITLRKTAPALLHGGYQDLFVEDGLWVFQRQCAEQQLIVVAHRGPDVLEKVVIPLWQAGVAPDAQMVDLLTGQTYTMQRDYLTLHNLNCGDALILEVR